MQVTGKQKSVFKDFNRKIYIFFLHKTTFLRETIQCFPLYKLSLFVISLCTNCLSLFWTLFQIFYTWLFKGNNKLSHFVLPSFRFATLETIYYLHLYKLSSFAQIISLCTNYLPLFLTLPWESSSAITIDGGATAAGAFVGSSGSGSSKKSER